MYTGDSHDIAVLASIILMPGCCSVRNSVRQGGNKKTGNNSLCLKDLFLLMSSWFKTYMLEIDLLPSNVSMQNHFFISIFSSLNWL